MFFMEGKKYFGLLWSFVLVLILVVEGALGQVGVTGTNTTIIPQRNEMVPAMFIFGDSLIDNGNNNNLPLSFAKANYFPYGIDFKGGPTGRFSNGYTIVDEIGFLSLSFFSLVVLFV